MAATQGTNENTSSKQDKSSGSLLSDVNDGSWLSKPENIGNEVGQHVQQTLQPMGDTIGGGLSSVVKPVGNVVDGVVGGVMRSGAAVSESLGIASENQDGGPKRTEERRQVDEQEEMKKGLGGRQQSARNPLGL